MKLDGYITEALGEKKSLTQMVKELRERVVEIAAGQEGSLSGAARVLQFHRNTLDRIRKGEQKRGW